MIITVAFDVKNYVEVMESWPLKIDNSTFFLEREGDVLKRVCISFSDVGLEHAPSLTPPTDGGEHAQLTIADSGYVALARKTIMNWQAIVSGMQIVNLDYDNLEMRFGAENFDEEARIVLKSIKTSFDQSLNAACDFEQIGRAFCADLLPDDQIESTSHYREGRLAFEAGRYVDAYNNMFLFLETRYCDGKTKTAQQIGLLSKQPNLCAEIESNASDFVKSDGASCTEKFELFQPEDHIEDKIKALVLLRGKLRHHSLKSPHRWDPNKQDEHKAAARFLAAVVHDIVIKESLESIYSPASLSKFRELSVATGFETKVKLTTHRLNNERAIELAMSYPTTVVSSLLCVNTVRHAIAACEKEGQIADTVKLRAMHDKTDLELFSIDFDVWAYTATREIVTEKEIQSIRCCFEYRQADQVRRGEFSIPFTGHTLSILDVWNLLRRSFDHIERKDPTTRIASLRLFLNKGENGIVTYRVGALVKN